VVSDRVLQRLVREALARTSGGSISDYFGLSVGKEAPPCHTFDLGPPRGQPQASADPAAQQAADAIKRRLFDHLFPPGTDALAFFIDPPTYPPAPYDRETAAPSDWLGPLGSPADYVYTRLTNGAPEVDAWLAERHLVGDFLHPTAAILVRVHRWGAETYAHRETIGPLQRLLAPAIEAFRTQFRAGG
jgi:hypothetical protein